MRKMHKNVLNSCVSVETSAKRNTENLNLHNHKINLTPKSKRKIFAIMNIDDVIYKVLKKETPILELSNIYQLKK